MDTKGVVVVFNMFVRHALSPMSSKGWIREYLRHYVRELVVRVDIREVHDVFPTPVSDNVVSDVDVFGAFRSHEVRRHADCGLVILVEDNRLFKFHVQLI